MSAGAVNWTGKSKLRLCLHCSPDVGLSPASPEAVLSINGSFHSKENSHCGGLQFGSGHKGKGLNSPFSYAAVPIRSFVPCCMFPMLQSQLEYLAPI